MVSEGGNGLPSQDSREPPTVLTMEDNKNQQLKNETNYPESFRSKNSTQYGNEDGKFSTLDTTGKDVVNQEESSAPEERSSMKIFHDCEIHVKSIQVLMRSFLKRLYPTKEKMKYTIAGATSTPSLVLAFLDFDLRDVSDEFWVQHLGGMPMETARLQATEINEEFTRNEWGLRRSDQYIIGLYRQQKKISLQQKIFEGSSKNAFIVVETINCSSVDQMTVHEEDVFEFILYCFAMWWKQTNDYLSMKCFLLEVARNLADIEGTSVRISDWSEAKMKVFHIAKDLRLVVYTSLNGGRMLANQGTLYELIRKITRIIQLIPGKRAELKTAVTLMRNKLSFD